MQEVWPEQMDRWSRNQRLYETLKGMGLYVSPIPEPSDPTRIKALIVSADLPIQQSAQDSTETCVITVVEGSQIRDIVRATDGDSDNVINFPSML